MKYSSIGIQYQSLNKPRLGAFCRLGDLMENIYYVYAAFVDKKLKYIGKGKGNRYEHVTSGCSHVY